VTRDTAEAPQRSGLREAEASACSPAAAARSVKGKIREGALARIPRGGGGCNGGSRRNLVRLAKRTALPALPPPLMASELLSWDAAPEATRFRASGARRCSL